MLIELLIIFAINYLGVILVRMFSIPLPTTIVGMIILLTLLLTKVLKVEQIEKTASALLLNMTILFLPPIVKLVENIELLKSDFVKILILLLTTTVITMVATAKVVHHMIIWKEGREKK